MKTVLFATENKSKAKRFEKDLNKKGIKLITINDLDQKVEVNENGKTGIENALIKAKAYAEIVDLPVFAMDDNLYLENVPEDKQPGVFVRRVNGKRLNDEEMIKHYTSLVQKYGKCGKLICKWVYGIATINKGKEATYTWSKDSFYMIDKPSEKRNPGYPLNSISKTKNTNKYFTDLTDDDKTKENNESDVIEFLCKNL